MKMFWGLAVAAGLVGCSSYESSSRVYSNATSLAPTQPELVQVLHEVPTRPYQRIGEVHVESSVDPTPDAIEIDNRLRRDGAALGADAVVVVHDIVRPVAADAPWCPWSDHVDVTNGRHLIAVAIRYQ